MLESRKKHFLWGRNQNLSKVSSNIEVNVHKFLNGFLRKLLWTKSSIKRFHTFLYIYFFYTLHPLHTCVSQAMLAGGGGLHVTTKLVPLPATDKGLCFFTLGVNLSNKIEVWGRVWNWILCTDFCHGLIACMSAGIRGLKVIDWPLCWNYGSTLISVRRWVWSGLTWAQFEQANWWLAH